MPISHMVNCNFYRRKEIRSNSGYIDYEWVSFLKIKAFSLQDRTVDESDIGSASKAEETTSRLFFSTLHEQYDERALKEVRPGDRCLIDGDIYSLKTGAKTVLSPFTGAKTTVIDIEMLRGVSLG